MEPYNDAASILSRVAQRRGSARSLCLDPRVQSKRVVFALVHETLRHARALDEVLASAGCDGAQLLGGGGGGGGGRGGGASNAELSRAAARLFAYELLVGRGLHRRAGWAAPEVRAALALVLKRREQLRAAFARLAPSSLPAAPLKLPRYVRANELKASVDEVEAALRRTHPTVRRDLHVPCLLVLPAGTDMHDHELVVSGQAILQEKASCMPVVALRAQPGWWCIDACAAPGNKTTQLAAALGARGRVDAFERDARRAELLRRRVGEAGAGSIVEVHRADFLAVDPRAFAGVVALLVDPSCSGSGIVGRLDLPEPRPGGHGPEGGTAGREQPQQQQPQEAALERLGALSAMQERILTHALSFGGARVVVYSTCSLHAQENEAVVANALKASAALGWRLADALPGWHRRGLRSAGIELSAAQCACCVRCLPEDGCGGFFIARFERVPTRAAPGSARGTRGPIRRSQPQRAARRVLRLQGLLVRATVGKARVAVWPTTSARPRPPVA